MEVTKQSCNHDKVILRKISLSHGNQANFAPWVATQLIKLDIFVLQVQVVAWSSVEGGKREKKVASTFIFYYILQNRTTKIT